MPSSRLQRSLAAVSSAQGHLWVERLTAAGRDGFARGYVRGVRGVRRVARATGAIDALDRHRHRRGALFLRSLFAVHDIDDLVDLDLPWWTLAAVQQVDAFIAERGGGLSAFEYGAGASTFWLARRCRSVVTVEHDRGWWQKLAPDLEAVPNVTGNLVPPVADGAPRCAAGRAGWGGYDFSEYVHTIERGRTKFDLIVIDGRARAACLLVAVEWLAPGGMIVFDNSNRRRYAAAIADSGLEGVCHGGFAPCVPWPSETMLLSRPEDR